MRLTFGKIRENLSTLAVLSTLASAADATPNAPCYYPGGESALLYQPCDQFAFISACCPSGFTCFSNNICILTDPNAPIINVPIGTALRPTCTNPSFSQRTCGNYCLENGSNGELTACGNDTYCCRYDELRGDCDCDSGEGTFVISPGEAETIIDVTGSNFTTVPPVIRSSTIPSTTATTTPDHSTTLSSIVLSTTIQGSSSGGPTSTTAPVDAGVDITDTTRFKVGVGIGSAVAGLLLLGFIVWFCVYRRRRKTYKEQPSIPPPYPHITRAYSQYSENHSDAPPRMSYQSAHGPNPVMQAGPLGHAYPRDMHAAGYTQYPYPGPGPLTSNPQAMGMPYNMSSRIGQDVGEGVPDMYTHLRPVSEVTEPSSTSGLSGPSPVSDRNSRAFGASYLTVDLLDEPGEGEGERREAVSSPISPMSSMNRRQKTQWYGRPS